MAIRMVRLSFGGLARRVPPRLATVSALLGILALQTACSMRLDARPPAGVDLSGQWVLVRDLSGSPERLLARHGEKSARRPVRDADRRHEGDSDDSSDDGGERHAHGRTRMEPPAALRTFLAQPEALSIRQLTGELKLVADGVPADYGYDDEVLESVGSSLVRRRTGWNGNAFVVNYAPADGIRATRSYQCAAGCQQLVVTTEVSGSRLRGVALRSVYRRGPPPPQDP